jgi:small GTP-binding protein
VLSFLEPPRLLVVSQVSRRFNDAASADRLWRPAAERLHQFLGIAWLAPTVALHAARDASVKEQCRARVAPRMQEETLGMKVVVAGDVGVGKTCLQARFKTNTFESQCSARFGKEDAASITIAGTRVRFYFWDMVGGQDYAQIRALCYADADVVLVCFDATSMASLASVRMLWERELEMNREKMAPSVKFVLAGTKVDLRDNTAVAEILRQRNVQTVAREDGIACAKELGMAAYGETSALTGEGVHALFRTCCVVFLQARVAAAGRGKCEVQ